MSETPRDFARTIIELYGETGVEWLERLPALITHCAQRWSLTVLPPFEPLSYNYVAPAVRTDGTPVVLKLGVPNPELRTEIEALRLYAGRGMVQLLEVDREQGAMLLKRLEPGTQCYRRGGTLRTTGTGGSGEFPARNSWPNYGKIYRNHDLSRTY